MNKKLIIVLSILILILSCCYFETASVKNDDDNDYVDTSDSSEVTNTLEYEEREDGVGEQDNVTEEIAFNSKESYNSLADEQAQLESLNRNQFEIETNDSDDNTEIITALHIKSSNFENEDGIGITESTESQPLLNTITEETLSLVTTDNNLGVLSLNTDDHIPSSHSTDTDESLYSDYILEPNDIVEIPSQSQEHVNVTEEILGNKNEIILDKLEELEGTDQKLDQTTIVPEVLTNEMKVSLNTDKPSSELSKQDIQVTEILADTISLSTTLQSDSNTSAHEKTSIIKLVSISTNRQPVERTYERNVLIEKCYQYPKIKICNKLTDMDLKHQGGWYYNPTEMQCQYTSDCIINDNYFKTKNECIETCEYWRGTARCLAPPQAGHFRCSAVNTEKTIRPILMVYFDKVSGKCRWFTYYGCGGSANRFTSITECENTCGNLIAYKILLVASQLCQVAPTTQLFPQWSRIEMDTWSEISYDGQFYSKEKSEPILFDNLTYIDAMRIEPECANVGQHESRWYLDVETNQCQEFAYSHCGGSSNNFLTRADCEQFCGATKPDISAICKLKPSFGECTGYKTMWYYDPNWVMNMDGQDHYLIGGCKQFNYSGCGGNSNRFPTQAACELTCQFNTKVELQINIDPVEGLNNVTTRSEPIRNKDNNQSTIVITESNKTIHNNLVKKMTKLTLMNIDLEPCRRHPVFGFCRPLNCSEEHRRNQTCHFLNFQRWFFNAHTSNCEAYSYSGCGASENTFDDAQACQAACKARIVRPDRDQRCDSNPHTKKCYTLSVSGSNQQDVSSEKDIIAFHFSMSSATCKAFHLNTKRPGCSMEQYFPNGYDCLRECVKSSPNEKHLQNRCFARKTHVLWNCTDQSVKTYRWSYLPEINQCVRFSECTNPDQIIEQPGNNFASRSECETTCMASSFEEVCQLPKDPGPCTSFQTRYFYDSSTSKCRVFLYGGCLGNFNRFLLRKECELACSQFSTHILSTSNHTKPQENSMEETLVGYDESPPLSAQVFEKMKQITQHHTDRYPWDICLDSHSYGTCSLSGGQYQTTSEYPYVPLTRYYYDRRLGQCQPYTYTGCGARGNHFDTLEKCQIVCENRLKNPKFARCHYDKPITKCPGSGIQAWAYNHTIGDCYFFEICEPEEKESEFQIPQKKFSFRLRRTSQWLGVWQARTGNLPEGIYATRSACQYHCLPKPPRGTDTQNVCHMNPIVTVPFGCNAMVTRWYFEPRETQCRSYITCPQYGNNFPSHKACQDICTPGHPIDVCRLPYDHGGCSNFEKRWYYDMQKRMCMPFTYGGCFGNSNRFVTKAECEGFCMGKDVCRLPLQKNSTDPSYPERFYYDHSRKQCLPFRFTGLLAHGNNFPSLSACNATCIYVPDIEVIAEKIMQSSNLNSDKKLEESNKTLIQASSMENPTNTQQMTDENTSISVHRIPTDNKNILSEKFPCLPFITSSQYENIDRHTFCNSEDIIHELGYRFQVTSSVHVTDETIDGICVPILVPICLNEPQRLYGQLNTYESQMIGRVFKTEAECEETCLLKNRFKRSIIMEKSFDTTKNIRQLLNKILDEKSKLSGHLNDSVYPILNYEMITDKQHNKIFQAVTHSFNQSNFKKTLTLEVLENEHIKLPCWIVSQNKPHVQWIHPLTGKRYPVTVHHHSENKNIWISHLLVHNTKTQLHTGGWVCEASDLETTEYAKATIILNVVSLQSNKILYMSSQNTVSSHDTIMVPKDGLVFISCPHYQYLGDTLWKKNGEDILQANSEYLVIEHANPKFHTGIWICGINYDNNFIELYKFNISVGYPPELQKSNTNLSKAISQFPLTCPINTQGEPAGYVQWFECKHTNNCYPLTTELYSSMLNQSILIMCRIENIWGMDETYFNLTT